MHSLLPLSALGATTAQIDRFDGLTIAENPDIALASLALRNGKKAGFSRMMKTAIGCGVPAPGRFDGAGKLLVFSTGLDQWMVQAPMATHEDLAVTLADQFKDAASVTEQNDGWVRFDIGGALAMPLFERLCSANVRAMTPGMVTRSAIEHLGCFVMCHKTGKDFGVIGPRSSASSLHHALITAARSVL